MLLQFPVFSLQFVKDSRTLVPELGTQLGLSVDRPASLTAEYLQWIRNVQMNYEKGQHHSWAKVKEKRSLKRSEAEDICGKQVCRLQMITDQLNAGLNKA